MTGFRREGQGCQVRLTQAGAEVLSHPSCPPRIQPQFLLHMALQQESSDRLQPGLRGKRLLQRQQASWTLVCDYGLTSPLIRFPSPLHSYTLSRSALEAVLPMVPPLGQTRTEVLRSQGWGPGRCSGLGPGRGATGTQGLSPASLGNFSEVTFRFHP